MRDGQALICNIYSVVSFKASIDINEKEVQCGQNEGSGQLHDESGHRSRIDKKECF